MGTSGFHLKLAEDNARRSTLHRDRARRALNSIRWYRRAGWSMYGGAAGGVMAAGLSVSVDQNWLTVALGVTAAAVLVPLKRFLIPRKIAQIEPLIAESETKASKLAYEAEREMKRFELQKWREDFNGLLMSTRPPAIERPRSGPRYGSKGLSQTEDTYGRFWDRQMKIEEENARQERIREKEEVARKMALVRAQREREEREHEVRMVEVTNLVGEREWVTPAEALSIEKEIRLRDREARRRSKEVLDLTDWQGDDDPRRIWADTVCEVCGDTMKDRRHTEHVMRNGRMIMVADESLSTYSKPIEADLSARIECSSCKQEFTPTQFLTHRPKCLERKRRTRELEKEVRDLRIRSEEALKAEGLRVPTEEETWELGQIVEPQEEDPRAIAEQVMKDLNAPSKAGKPKHSVSVKNSLEPGKAYRLRCEVCGQYMTVGGPNSTAGKHAHGRDQDDYQAGA
ncbi:hypothetical protein SEA_RASPUTIA_110 [Microbacterium phage Rasputia]|nr:hypothetical protein SEA_RASPUTIA_110 [Microbacterium phage Rasputia]